MHIKAWFSKLIVTSTHALFYTRFKKYQGNTVSKNKRQKQTNKHGRRGEQANIIKLTRL